MTILFYLKYHPGFYEFYDGVDDAGQKKKKKKRYRKLLVRRFAVDQNRLRAQKVIKDLIIWDLIE